MTSFGKAYVIITGASKGFGRWLATEMNTKMGKGSKMVLMGRDEDKLAGIKAEVSKNSEVEAITVSLELADKAKVKDTFTSILASETGYEKAILINNAAAVNDVSRPACELWLDDENTDNYTQVNISSFLCMTATFLNHFKLDANSQSTVVNVSSAFATFPIPSFSLYSGCKAARDIMYRILALEEPTVRVLTYKPGTMATGMAETARDETYDRNVSKMIGEFLEREITPERSAKYLCQVLLDDTFPSGSIQHPPHSNPDNLELDLSV